MAKSKHAPALFEVIQSRHEGKPPGSLPLPKWWRSPSPQPSEKKEDPALPETPAPPETPAVATDPTPVPAAAAPAPSVAPADPPAPVRAYEPLDLEETPPPKVAYRDGRINLSLTPVNAAVVAGVVVLAVMTSYLLGGRSTGEPAEHTTITASTPQDPIEQLAGQPPKPDVLEVAPPRTAPRNTTAQQPSRAGAGAGVPKAPELPAPPPAAKPAGQASGTHVVLESFGADDKASAEFAQKWFAAKQIPTTLNRVGNRWRLISIVAFNDEQAMQQYVDNVKALGKECARELGRARLTIYTFTSPGRISSRDLE